MPKEKLKIYLVGQFELSEAGKKYVEEKILPELRRIPSVEILEDPPISEETVNSFMKDGNLATLSESARKRFLLHKENLEKADLVLVFICSEGGFCSEGGSCPDPETAWALGVAFANKKYCIGCRDSFEGFADITDSIALSFSRILRYVDELIPAVKEFLRLREYSE